MDSRTTSFRAGRDHFVTNERVVDRSGSTERSRAAGRLSSSTSSHSRVSRRQSRSFSGRFNAGASRSSCFSCANRRRRQAGHTGRPCCSRSSENWSRSASTYRSCRASRSSSSHAVWPACRIYYATGPALRSWPSSGTCVACTHQLSSRSSRCGHSKANGCCT